MPEILPEHPATALTPPEPAPVHWSILLERIDKMSEAAHDAIGDAEYLINQVLNECDDLPPSIETHLDRALSAVPSMDRCQKSIGCARYDARLLLAPDWNSGVGA